MDNQLMGPSINLLRSPIAASRARSLLAYLLDMSRRSLRGSLPSGLLVTISRRALILLALGAVFLISSCATRRTDDHIELIRVPADPLATPSSTPAPPTPTVQPAAPVTPPPPATSNNNPPANVNLTGYPLPYRQGYADGCASRRSGNEQKDATRFKTDMQYRTGWQDGHSICKSR